MRLFFTSLRNKTELRSFSYKLTHLEQGLDFLNFVTAQGDVLLKAHIVDEYSILDLPIEAFDGVPFSNPIKSLEQEWKNILRKKAYNPSRVYLKLIELAVERIHNCELRIAGHSIIIDRTVELTKRTEEALHREPKRSNLLSQYQSQLKIYRQQMAQSQANHKELVVKLNKLKA